MIALINKTSLNIPIYPFFTIHFTQHVRMFNCQHSWIVDFFLPICLNWSKLLVQKTLQESKIIWWSWLRPSVQRPHQAFSSSAMCSSESPGSLLIAFSAASARAPGMGGIVTNGFRSWPCQQWQEPILIFALSFETTCAYTNKLNLLLSVKNE